MELYQLRTFLAVAELGHTTRAAEKLHLSQPAVSAQIKSLEDELGATLFERTSSGMRLTRAGTGLLPYAERVLDAAQELKTAARAMQGEVSGRLRVGTVSDPQSLRLGLVLSKMVETHPLVAIELHHEVSGVALEKVAAGRLDASFYFGDLDAAGVAGLALGAFPYRVTGPAAWKERIEGAAWSEIAAQPWVMTPPVSTHSQLVRRLFRERGLAPTQVVEADNESVIATLVAAGVGLSLMRENLALDKQARGEVCVWEPGRVETTLWFVYPVGRERDPLIAALLDAVRETWRNAGGSSEAKARPAG